MIFYLVLIFAVIVFLYSLLGIFSEKHETSSFFNMKK